jgi:arylsulfate sulfotransferase
MRIFILLLCGSVLASCGGSSGTNGGGSGLGSSGGSSIAQTSDVRYSAVGQGLTAFTQLLELDGNSLRSISSVAYTIQPKPGATAAPVHVLYSLGSLQSRGYVKAPQTIQIPVFGLYANYLNQVSFELVYSDNSVQTLPATVQTAAYHDPRGVFDAPTILRARQPGTPLGFNYIMMKPEVGSPVIVDTDGEVRWIATGIPSAESSTYRDNAFFVGSNTSMLFTRIDLDGSVTSATPAGSGYINFHHNIDHGRDGLLAEIHTTKSAGSTFAELNAQLAFTREWDLGSIIAEYMGANGDDADAFVRDAADWFHSNSATYRASDNTLIVSSRENFLIALDYDTSEIKWILGDPTKYWYQFPSLQSKALTLQGPGDYPMGQHAVSITRDDLIMVFNDGEPSYSQPAGTPRGDSRTYSGVSIYQVDPQHHAATQVWAFDYGQSILSRLCSSVYQVADGSLLVDYSLADNGQSVRMVGLDSSHQVSFDFRYVNIGQNSAWNAMPVPLEDIHYN